MFARNDVRAKLVLVGRRQAVARAKRAAVEPGPGLDMGPFQGEDQAAALPIGRNFHLALVPGSADVVPLGLKPEGHLDVTRLTVFLVLGRGEPGSVHDLAGPRCVHRNWVAMTLGLG